jgi:hypothetical protein
MQKITAKTPRKEATIKGVRLAVPTPYAEGDSLNINEASTLNQTYIENIRNNLSGHVAAAIEEAGGVDKLDQKAVQKLVDDYCAEYKFGEKKGGGFRSADPVEAAGMELARGLVRDAIVAKGIKLKDVPAAKVTELARAALEQKPEILERAKAIVAARQKAAAELKIEIPV